MVHTQSFWSRRYIGTLEVTLVDGRIIQVSIHKDGRTIWINQIIVHPSNQDSFDGIIREIGEVYKSPVNKHEWKTYVRNLKFDGR